MSNYLGIDYGTVHIGLSLAEATLATPLPTLQNDDRLFSSLLSLIKTHQITHIVCGIPEGRLAPTITAFARKLEELSHLPVTLHQETLTTQEAKQKLSSLKTSRAKRKNDHAYAACLILEDYLDLMQSS